MIREEKGPKELKKYVLYTLPSRKSGGYLETDTIETIVGSLRRYTICAIDVKLKIAYAQTFKSKSSKNAKTVLENLALMLPVPIQTIQTDNGSEFLGVFNHYCRENEIKHHFTYPKHPKVNGVVERFNRSIQEEWLNIYQDEMAEPALINQRIVEYLLFYHNDRIHEGLGDRTPASIIGKEIKSPKGV
ncbi:MAG: integrase core domain-containing protein [Patescibacteria group bacterium]